MLSRHEPKGTREHFVDASMMPRYGHDVAAVKDAWSRLRCCALLVTNSGGCAYALVSRESFRVSTEESQVKMISWIAVGPLDGGCASISAVRRD